MAMKALLLLGLVAACYGASIPLLNPRIVNGEDAKLGEIPYQVSLQLKGSDFHFCGGSVLNKNYVITAAHCVIGKQAHNVQVVAGTVDLTASTKSVHNAVQLIPHKQYDAYNSYINDIALIKVAEPFVQTKVLDYVPLPSRNEVIDPLVPAVVSGWGRLWQGGVSPTKLQRVDLLIADQDYCRAMYKNMYENIHDSQICAFDPQTSKGSCHGDSGGPLTVNGKLIGLVSWARACALTDYPTVYTRVSEHLDWIEANAV